MPIKRALVVDDSKAAGLALRRMLEQHSVAVDLADSGESALTYLKSQVPDVIFMDHIMPGLNGLEAAKAITGDPKTAAIPIVMYTSTEGDSYLDKAKAHGAVGILPKPPKPAALAQWIHQLGGTPEKIARPPVVATPTAAPPAALSAEAVETLARGAAESVVRNVTQVLVMRSIEEQLPHVRQDILARCETIAKQVAAEFLHARVTELNSQLRAVQDQFAEFAARPVESAGANTAAHAEVETLARAIAEQAAAEVATQTARGVAQQAAGDAAAQIASETARQVAAEVYQARVAPIADQLRAEIRDQLAQIEGRQPTPAALSAALRDELANSTRAAAKQAATETATEIATQAAREAAQAAAHDVAATVARHAAEEVFAERGTTFAVQLKREVAAQLADFQPRPGEPATALAPEVLEELKSVTRHVAGQRLSESAQKAVHEALQQSSQDLAKQAARMAARQLDKAMEIANRSQMNRVYFLSAAAAGFGVLAAFLVHLLR